MQKNGAEEMALRELCKYCNQTTIARRIKGVYVGSLDEIKIWQCRECKALWSEN